MDAPFDTLLPQVTLVLKSEHPPGWRLSARSGDYATLNYCLRGEARFVVNGAACDLSEGDVLYIKPGERKEAGVTGGESLFYYSFHVHLRGLDGSTVDLPFPLKFHAGRDTELIEYCEKLHEVWLEHAPGFDLKARGLFTVILSILKSSLLSGGGENVRSPLVRKVTTYVLSHHTEPIMVREIASHLRMNPVYLGNRFKAETGMTVKEYLNRIRVNRARDLLASGGFTAKEAAFLVGFQDAYYFSRVFSRLMGFSPSRLKR